MHGESRRGTVGLVLVEASNINIGSYYCIFISSGCGFDLLSDMKSGYCSHKHWLTDRCKKSELQDMINQHR